MHIKKPGLNKKLYPKMAAFHWQSKLKMLPFNAKSHLINFKIFMLVLILISVVFILYYVFLYQCRKTVSLIFKINDVSYFQDLLPDMFVNYNKFLVYNEKCRIPNLTPFNEDVVPHVQTQEYLPCSEHEPLVYLEQFGNGSVLAINDTLRSTYSSTGNVTCFYSIVEREIDAFNQDIDDSFRLSNFTPFSSNATFLPSVEYILVKCTVNVTIIFSQAFSTVFKRRNILKKLRKYSDAERPVSVTFIGIDSISRLNLYRAMPHTLQYLKSTGWFEMRGYNKIDDNTFPNLMAIFTGLNGTGSFDTCNPEIFGKLDVCPMLWYTFRDKGYATAYAEDEGDLGTFNYNKKGFRKKPTDHYLRPLIRAAEKTLPSKKINNLFYCLGSVTSEDAIFSFADRFFRTYRDDSYFGLFWMNTFSHNELNTPSRLDLKTANWLKEIEASGIYNSSIVIFLSDHGIRFGNIRKTYSGWMEERLPFLFIWLPEKFRNKFPDAVKNLQINTNRFITPYDLHMTLQDVLVRYGLQNSVTPSLACPNCTSLFNRVDFQRGCEDVNMDMHWCTCYDFERVSIDSAEVVEAAETFAAKIQDILASDANTRKLCRRMELSSVIEARVSKQYANQVVYIVLVIKMRPGGQFEGTILRRVGRNGQNHYEMSGAISRIDEYGDSSSCVSNVYHKLFCYCRKRYFKFW